MMDTMPLGDGFARARTFSHDGFDAVIYLKSATAGFFVGHVDVHENGAHRCRIVLAGKLDHGAAIIALIGKCKDWIAARGRGDAAGASRFDAL